MFTNMSEELCFKKKWNDGDVGRYGCDGLICPPGTYNNLGRRNEDENLCKTCDVAKYYGSVECSLYPEGSSSSASNIFGTSILWGSVVGVVVCLLL